MPFGGTDMPRRVDGNIQHTRLESFTACIYLVWPDEAARIELYYTAGRGVQEGMCAQIAARIPSLEPGRPSGGSICLLLLMLMLPHHARSGLTGPTL